VPRESKVDTVTSSYHPLVSGLLTNITVSQPSGSYSATYGYDAAKRLSSVTSTAGTFNYLYTNAVTNLTAAGRLVAKLSLPNTSYITNTFDSEARELSTVLKNSGNTMLNSHAYTYNKGSQRTVMTRSDASTVTYTYDSLGEVIKALGSGGYSTENLGYGYDPAWNLNKRTNNGSVTTFSVNNLNELSTGYTYDYNGNETARSGAYQYSYDDENQLTSANANGGYWQHSFVYDGRGRLRTLSDYTWNGSNYVLSATTRYIYAGMRVVQERNGNNPMVSYVYGTDVSGTFEGAGGIGGLLARSSGTGSGSWITNVFYYADGNGNIANLVDGSQNVVATYRYDPFGQSKYAGGAMSQENVYRFSSKRLIGDPLLYYYGYRFYDTANQRWLNRDPLGDQGFLSSKVARHFTPSRQVGELIGGPNLFAFVLNSPGLQIDRNGLEAGLCYYQASNGEWTCKGPDLPHLCDGLGKACRAACWGAAAGAAALTCPAAGPGAALCAVAWAAAASLCSDACPP